jgi:RNA polymerase sigma factor (sigma-70 family)
VAKAFTRTGVNPFTICGHLPSMTDPGAAVSLADRLLLLRVRQGSPGAFRLLYRRHTPRMRRVLLSVLSGDTMAVDDCVQETWLAAMRGLATFRGDAAFATWLHTITLRTAYRLHRREPTDADWEPLAELVPMQEEPLALRVDLDCALAQLPERERTVLLMHDVAGHGHAEIAAAFDMPEGTSKSTLHRARRRMRELLDGGHDAG